MTWADAVDYCHNRDAVLPSIHNSEENAYISDKVCMTSVQTSLLTQGCWIGLTDEEEGVWRWLDGTNSSDYENWHYEKLNNRGKIEHYALLWGTGTWNDSESETNLWAICMRAVPTENPTLSSSDSQTLPPTADLTASLSFLSSPSTTNPAKLPTSPSAKLKSVSVPVGVSLIIIIIILLVSICVVYCCALPRARRYCGIENPTKLDVEKDRLEGETNSQLNEMHQRTQDIDSRV